MQKRNGQKRVVIESVYPEINEGQFDIKRVVGEPVRVTADIFCDGHEQIRCELLYRQIDQPHWSVIEMEHLVNDRWQGEFQVTEVGKVTYSIRAWVDEFETWREDVKKKHAASQKISVEILTAAELIDQGLDRCENEHDKNALSKFAQLLRQGSDIPETVSLALSVELRKLMNKYPDRTNAVKYKDLAVKVERLRAAFSAWYEFFPRSAGPGTEHGNFNDCRLILPDIAGMGFDIIYLPPIHPVGKTNKKGPKNAPEATVKDPGSCWAIGSSAGGHKAIHPQLGTLDDFKKFIKTAAEYDIEIAIDLAYQCSPDHPYISEHPEWFKFRPDGSIQFAENPPKKYEDVIPINFVTDTWQPLWDELKSIVIFWIETGIKIFRVDNPHTKPFSFWHWLITEINDEYPDVIFLSEAFTRPKVMRRLAKVGFTQSYTYFTWRNTKYELTQYMEELTGSESVEYMRPNFWPNTPDILTEYLQYGQKPAFIIRLILAATLSSNYGIYGPAFELCVSEALPGTGEYLDSEKYEIKDWDRNRPGNIKPIITLVNLIRSENPALKTTQNVRFHDFDNDMVIFYSKTTRDLSNMLLIFVNLDPYHKQSGWANVPLELLGIKDGQPYMVHDLLSNDKYVWQGRNNFVELDPNLMPAHIFKLYPKMRRETDFDYFM